VGYPGWMPAELRDKPEECSYLKKIKLKDLIEIQKIACANQIDVPTGPGARLLLYLHVCHSG